MTAFAAYLARPQTRAVLSKKPGENGFSLIELVVVVAVLAILAAIAIPAFTSISERARASAAANTVAQIAKECAAKIAAEGSGTYNSPSLDGYRTATAAGWYMGGTKVSGTQTCPTSGTIATVSDDTSKYPTFTYDVGTGAKTCTATGDALKRGCPTSGGAW
jgi:prepilin-type N-terminal cleavage/methylation domain-containing protein